MSSSYPNTCSICLDDISLSETKKDNSVTMLECNHPFHTRCISQLRSNKCPSCRSRFTKISSKILSPILQRENADILSRNTENLNFVLDAVLLQPMMDLLQPSPHLFERPEPWRPSDFVAALMRLLSPSIYPIIFTLLNTPFQGITLNSMLEDYIVRQGLK